jgi:GTPase SAR1 family protein
VSGFFGSKSSGKTTLINKITDEFIRHAATTAYDLENPFINNGPISHYYYVSPSIISDNTLKNNSFR